MGVFDQKIHKMLKAQTPVYLATDSRYAIGTQLATRNITPASATWNTANWAIGIPFVMPSMETVKKLWTMNGANVSGNIDVGIYDENGNQMVSKGSTTHTTIGAIQSYDVTDTVLPAGRYYLAVVLDNTTGELVQWTMTAGTGGSGSLGTVVADITALPLPATITWAAAGGILKVPLIGLSLRTAT